MGVLPRPARTRAGYRQYPVAAADRVLLVRGALGVGFSLDELAGVLRVRDSGGAPCRQVHALAVEKLSQLDKTIAELTALRSQFAGMVRQWETKLQKTPDGQRARLLETLIAPRRKGSFHET